MQKRNKVHEHNWRIFFGPFRAIRRPRRWEDLPGLALVNIFCKTDFVDRLFNIPLVCKAWKSALEHPDCWSSMLPNSSTVSPEDVFIKKCNLFPENLKLHQRSLETLLMRSGGGSAITSLYVTPFFSTPRFCPYNKSHIYESEIDDLNKDWKEKNYATKSQVFRLIANSCPNLKHISFHKFEYYFDGMEEDLLDIIRSCKKLELVDFFCSKQLDSATIIQEMANNLPLLRGIRILGWRYYEVADCIATHLPRLKLLNFGSSELSKFSSKSSSLSTILSSCVNLQYLNVSPIKRQSVLYLSVMPKPAVLGIELIDQACARIPEFYWCDDGQYSVQDFVGWRPWDLWC